MQQETLEERLRTRSEVLLSEFSKMISDWAITEPEITLILGNVRRINNTLITETIAETIKAGVSAIEGKEFEMNIDEYLPKVKAWQGGYDKPFDDGFAAGKSTAVTTLQGLIDSK